MNTSSASGYGKFAEIFEKKVTYRVDRQQEEIAEIKKVYFFFFFQTNNTSRVGEGIAKEGIADFGSGILLEFR
jgi:hypothetical protein